MLGWGWRAAPGWIVYTAAVLVANAITSVLYPVGLALVIDASLQHQPGGVILGVTAIVGPVHADLGAGHARGHRGGR